MKSPDYIQYERILDSHPDLLMLIDARTWKVVALNEKIAKSLGHNKEDLIGKEILKFFPPQVAELREKMGLQVIQKKKAVFFEDRRDNRWFKNSFYPILNDQGEVAYGLIIVQDITREKEIDEQLKTSEERYKELVNNLNDGVSTIDEKANFVFVNDTIVRRSGISADKWKHINYLDLLCPEYKEKVRRILTDLFAGKKVKPFVVAYKTTQGKKIYTEVNARAQLSDRKIKYVHAITRDITDRIKVEEALRLSEKKYRQLVNLIKDGIFTLDSDGKVTYLNKIAVERSGIPLKKWQEIKLYDTALPEYRSLGITNFKKIMNGETVSPFIIAYNGPNNKKRYIELNTGPIRDDTNKIIGLHGISRDVTDTVNAQNELRESEELYRTLLQTSPDPIILTDLQGNIITVSEEAYNLHGVETEKELIGANSFNFIPPEELHKAQKLYIETLEKGSVKGIEIQLKKKDGSIFIAEVNTGLLRHTDGAPKAFFGIFRDVTDRKVTEEKLRESEEKYRSIFTSSEGGIILTDMNGIITTVNPAAIKILRYTTAKELIGRSCINDYLNPKQHTLIMKELNQNGYITNQEITLVRKDGTYVYCIMNLTYLLDNKGKRRGVIGTYTDISDKIIAEQQIKKTKEYLQKIIDNTSDIIFSINSKNKILSWNKTAERILGYAARSILGKKIDNVDIFVDPSQIKTHIEQAIQNKPLELTELSLYTIDGDRRLIRISSSIIKDEKSNIQSILFTGHDITEESEVHKRLKFDNGYLFIDSSETEVENVFENLLKTSEAGLHITRSSHQKKMYSPSLNVQYAYLSKGESIHKSRSTIGSIDDLISTINNFISTKRNAVVLLDRVDYLISLYSFEEVLQAVYQIHDEIQIHHALLLLRISKNILSPSQQALLSEELNQLPETSIDTIEISEKLFTILQLIQNRTDMNEQVTFVKVEKSVHISKATTHKRLLELQSLGLISIRKMGRIKTVQITSTGKKLMQKRKSI
jgi:PAS domain S-box-containing protein